MKSRFIDQCPNQTLLNGRPNPHYHCYAVMQGGTEERAKSRDEQGAHHTTLDNPSPVPGNDAEGLVASGDA